MTYEVRYSPSALRDLERIRADVLHVSGNSNTAFRYISEFLDKVESKKCYPKSGTPLYYEDGFTGYYYVAYKAYLAFYRIKDETILVDRILPGKSDYMRRLHLG